ncbi:hypothetical protein OXIME_001337 [Oxyplasma meridianum]|uniref:Uncharacterized protein n=1 Tax=Oxyplasma meridianum TaxID=3073602 RepID=A0AAX4NI68_9ARCH
MESNNLDESMIFGIYDYLYLEYVNDKKLKEWILTLKPRVLKDKGRSKTTLWKVKNL